MRATCGSWVPGLRFARADIFSPDLSPRPLPACNLGWSVSEGRFPEASLVSGSGPGWGEMGNAAH